MIDLVFLNVQSCILLFSTIVFQNYFINFIISVFCSNKGFRAQALAVTSDAEHKFDLALHLGELKIAHELAVEAEVYLTSFTAALGRLRSPRLRVHCVGVLGFTSMNT